MRVLPVSHTIIISVRTYPLSFRIFDRSESSITQNLRSLICPAYHDQSHVVLARLAASEVLGRTQHGKKRAASTGTTGNLCRSCQALCTELSTILVSALRNTVGIAQQCVARP